jgi:hypothetical protein
MTLQPAARSDAAGVQSCAACCHLTLCCVCTLNFFPQRSIGLRSYNALECSTASPRPKVEVSSSDWGDSGLVQVWWCQQKKKRFVVIEAQSKWK